MIDQVDVLCFFVVDYVFGVGQFVYYVIVDDLWQVLQGVDVGGYVDVDFFD